MANKEKKQKSKNRRKGWFEVYKSIMRLGIKKSDFLYLGGKPQGAAIILSNHVGTSAPLAWELYNRDVAFRFWGADEMNSGLINLYKYQTKVYYHEKKHWNLFLARLYCLIASPLTYLFYKGLNLISIYRDMRFRRTITESIRTFEDGKAVIIFPEISDKGYLDELEGFHQGFLMLAKICLKNGIDVPVYVSYYRKGERKYVVDKPIMLSELLAGGKSNDEIAKMLCDRCNELGRMKLEEPVSDGAEEGEKAEEMVG